MSNETVIGKDFESHIALLWCQWNAKEITAEEAIRKIGEAIPQKTRREKWIWYNKQKRIKKGART